MPLKTKQAVRSFFSILKKVGNFSRKSKTNEYIWKQVHPLITDDKTIQFQHKLKMMHSAKILMISFGSPHQ